MADAENIEPIDVENMEETEEAGGQDQPTGLPEEERRGRGRPRKSATEASENADQNIQAQLQQQIISMSQKLKKEQKENTKRQNEIKGLNAKVTSLQKDNNSQKNEISSLNDEMGLIKNENQQLLTDVEDLKAELTDERAEKESLHENLDKYRGQTDMIAKPKALLVNDTSMAELQKHLTSSDSMEWEFTDVDNLNDLAMLSTCDDNRKDLSSYHVIVISVGSVDLNNKRGSDKCFMTLMRCLNLLKNLAKVAIVQVPPVKNEETRSEVSGFNHKISKISDSDIQVILNSQMGHVARAKLTDECNGHALTSFGGQKYGQLITKELNMPDSKKSSDQKTSECDLDGSEHVKEMMNIKQNMIGLVVGTGGKTKMGLEKDHGVRINTGKWVDLRGPQAIPGREIHGALIEGPRVKVQDAKERILSIVDSVPERGQRAEKPQPSAAGSDSNNNTMKSKADEPTGAPSTKRMRVKKP